MATFKKAAWPAAKAPFMATDECRHGWLTRVDLATHNPVRCSAPGVPKPTA